MQHEKTCKIHGELAREHIIVEPNKSAKRGYTLRCSHCKNDKDTRYKQSHRKELVQKNAVYKANNRDIVNKWEREDRKRNPEKYRRYEANYIAKHGIEKVRKMEVARIHGLTIEEYDALILSRNNLCDICKKEEKMVARGGHIKPLSIDHCHNSQENGIYKIRGLLCHHCNAGLGHFFDNIVLLESAIRYLEHHRDV